MSAPACQPVLMYVQRLNKARRTSILKLLFLSVFVLAQWSLTTFIQLVRVTCRAILLAAHTSL